MNKRRILLALTLVASVLALSASKSTPVVADRLVSPVDVLMVAGTATGDVGDRAVADAIRAGGHSVTIVDDDSVTAADANGYDVVFIASTAAAWKIKKTFTATAVGVVNAREYLHDDLGLTGNSNSVRGSAGSFDSIDIADPAHPILADLDPLPTGRVEVFRAKKKVSWGVPAASARIAATQPGQSSRAVLFSYDTGDLLATGKPAPGRRVGLFIHMSSDQVLDVDGARLTRAAVGWTAHASGGSTGSENRAPSVSAGVDRSVQSTGPVTVELTGTVTDDGLPEGGAVSVGWTGPPAADIASPDALTTDVTLPGPGSYEFTLTASDTEAIARDNVTVTVRDPQDGPERVLMIAAIDGGYQHDRLVGGLLTDAGFDVTIVDDNTATVAMATGYDVVVVTATSDHRALDPSFRSAAVPMVVYAPLLYDTLALTASGSANRSEQGSFRDIDIVDPTHPIADGLSGTTRVYTAWSKVGWGRPAADAVVVARQLNRASRATLFTYDTGDTLVDGEAAPARRVGLFVTRSSDSRLDATGRALVVRSVEWAVDGRAPAPPAENDAPTVGAGAAITTTVGVATALVGTVSDDGLPAGSVVTVAWSGPPEIDIADPSSASTTFTASESGSYTLTLTASDGALEASDTVAVTVTAPNEPPRAAATIDPSVGQAPLSVAFDASTSTDGDGTIASYTWNFGDGSPPVVENDPTAAHTYSADGTFTVSLTVTDDDGASDSVIVGTVVVESDVVVPVPVRPKDCKVETCNVLVVGDSVSDGQDTWRELFKGMASSAGYQFNYVGARRYAAPGEEIPYQNPPYDPSPGEDDQYEAYGGACIGDGNPTNCANLSPTIWFRGTVLGLWGRIDIWSAIIDTPDVVIVLAGHNGGGDKAYQFEKYLEKLFTVVPDSTYVFISPTGGASAIYDSLVTMAEQYRSAGKYVFAVSSYDGVTSPDGVHPDENGKVVLANNMFAGVDPVLAGGIGLAGGSGGGADS